MENQPDNIELPSKFKEALLRLYKTKIPVQFSVDASSVWCLISAVQLACRHPNFKGPTRVAAEGVARAIGDLLTKNDPDLKLLFAMGWQKEFDMPGDDKAKPGA